MVPVNVWLYTELDLKETVAAVRSQAAANPDYRYKDDNQVCFYLNEHNEPSCLLGRAMHSVGVSKERLDELDNNENDSGFSYLYKHAQNPEKDIELPDLARWLQFVQERQDEGSTDSEAVLLADLQYPNILNS